MGFKKDQSLPSAAGVTLPKSPLAGIRRDYWELVALISSYPQPGTHGLGELHGN